MGAGTLEIRGLGGGAVTVVIPNGVSSPEPLPTNSRATIRRELGVPEDVHMVLTAARLADPEDNLTFLRAAKVPVVATDLPATKDLLGDAGVLLPGESATRLADAIRDRLADPPAPADRGGALRARARLRCSLEIMLEAAAQAWRRSARHRV